MGKIEETGSDSGTSRESLIDLVGTTRFDRKTETLYQNDVVFITHLAQSILHTYMMSLSVSPVFLHSFQSRPYNFNYTQIYLIFYNNTKIVLFM